MEDVYLRAFTSVMDRVRENPEHTISLVEICEILLEERHRRLAHDQADMFGICLNTVDIAPIG